MALADSERARRKIFADYQAGKIGRETAINKLNKMGWNSEACKKLIDALDDHTQPRMHKP